MFAKLKEIARDYRQRCLNSQTFREVITEACFSRAVAFKNLTAANSSDPSRSLILGIDLGNTQSSPTF